MNKPLLGLLLVSSALAGCSTQTYHISHPAQSTPITNKMQNFFVSGLGQEETLNAAEVCLGAQNVAKIQTQQSFLDGFLGTITNGIYTPRHIRVYCTPQGE